MRRRLPLLLLLLLLVLVLVASSACGGGDATATAPAPADAGTACEDGEQPVADGCEPIVGGTTCAPGTRAAVGSASCVPVGPPACPAGFVAHASGWGCRPVLAPAACTGATRESLGSTSCVAVGDCNAAFPPAGATITVDASLADAQVDATHKKTIGAAVDAAAAGAVLAIAPGTYAENVQLDKELTLVGRCAEKVIVEGATTKPAIAVIGAKVALRGVTVRGGSIGLDAVADATEVTVEDSVLEANVGAGIDAVENAKVIARRVVVRGTVPNGSSGTTNGIFADVQASVRMEDGVVVGAADAGIGATGGSTITLVRSIVRDSVPRPDGVGGAGARAFERGTVDLEESAVVASRGTGVLAGRTKGAAKLVRTSVVDTKLDDRYGASTAVSVADGASLEIDGSTMADNVSATIVATGAGTKATVTSTAIVATRPGGAAGSGSAFVAADGATVDVKSTAVFQAAFVAIQSSGAGAKIAFDGGLVAQTQPAAGSRRIPDGTGGVAVTVIRGGAAVVTDSTFEGAREAALAAGNAGSTLSLDHALVRGTLVDGKGQFGHGVLALPGSRVTVSRSVVEASAAVGVVFAGATGSLERTTVRRNAVGIQVQQGSTVVESDTVPDPIDDGSVVVTTDSRFTDNATKTGSGDIPLPAIVPLL